MNPANRQVTDSERHSADAPAPITEAEWSPFEIWRTRIRDARVRAPAPAASELSGFPFD